MGVDGSFIEVLWKFHGSITDVHGIFMIASWKFHGNFMEFSWIILELPRTKSHGRFCGRSRKFHGNFTDVHGSYMEGSRTFYRSFMEDPYPSVGGFTNEILGTLIMR